MNSKVVLASPVWDSVREYQLVYPQERAEALGALSLFPELGASLFAAKIGDRDL